jgi:hypothetical protein
MMKWKWKWKRKEEAAALVHTQARCQVHMNASCDRQCVQVLMTMEK